MSLLAPVIPRTRAERWAWSVRDAWAVTRRDLLHWVAEPMRIVAALLWSVMFVLLFGYVFGSGMEVPGGGDYLAFLLPGLFVQTMAFGIGETMTAVAADAQRGITDRFRTLPMAPSAVVVGRSLADMLNAALGLAVLLSVGLVVGWAPNGSAGDTVLAVGLLLLLRFASLWVGILLGLLVRSPEAAAPVWGVLFPVTMLTSAFVAPELMPGWLGFIAEWNPLSSTIGATRELFANPGAPAGGSWVSEHALLMAVVWPLTITAVFGPLSVRRYRRMSR
jgi:ABC-type polysaccharide/polyol phosphate export permease